MPKIGGIYQGVEYHFFRTETTSEIEEADQFFNELVESNQQEAVVCLTYIPEGMIAQNLREPLIRAFQFGAAPLIRPNDVDGYVPKNKKLLSYPYMALCLDTLNDIKTYRYEYFKGVNIAFRIYASCSPHPEIIVAPYMYNGMQNTALTDKYNITESITLSGFPMVAFTIDAYKAWVAQKAIPESASLLGGIAQGAMSAGLAGLMGSKLGPGVAVAGAVGSLATSAISAIGQGAEMHREATQGSKIRGDIGTSVLAAAKKMALYVKFMSIRADYARMIDDFFSRFGYTCRRVKIPNRNVRPYWTYTKTNKCIIKGGLPAEVANKICSIYDNGITFWTNGNNVGDYSLDNSPLNSRNVVGGGRVGAMSLDHSSTPTAQTDKVGGGQANMMIVG